MSCNKRGPLGLVLATSHQLKIRINDDYAQFAKRCNLKDADHIVSHERPRGRSPVPRPRTPTDKVEEPLSVPAERHSMHALHGKKSQTLPLSEQKKKKIGNRCLVRTIGKQHRSGYRTRVFPKKHTFKSSFKGIAWCGDVALFVTDSHFGLRRSVGNVRRVATFDWTTPTGEMRTQTMQLLDWSSRTHRIDGILHAVSVSNDLKQHGTPQKLCVIREHHCLKQAAAEVTKPGRQMIYVKPAHYDKYFIASMNTSNHMCCPTCTFSIGTPHKTRTFNLHFGLEGRWSNLEWTSYTPNAHCSCKTCSLERMVNAQIASLVGVPQPFVADTIQDLAASSASASAFVDAVHNHTWRHDDQQTAKHSSGLKYFEFSTDHLLALYTAMCRHTA